MQGVPILNKEVQEALLRFEKDLKKRRSESCSRGDDPLGRGDSKFKTPGRSTLA